MDEAMQQSGPKVNRSGNGSPQSASGADRDYGHDEEGSYYDDDGGRYGAGAAALSPSSAAGAPPRSPLSGIPGLRLSALRRGGSGGGGGGGVEGYSSPGRSS